MLFAQDEVTLTRELLVSLDPNMHIQIALATTANCLTMTFQTNGSPIVNSRRYFHSDRLFTSLRAGTTTARASFLRYLTFTFTIITGNRLLDSTEHGVDNANLLSSTLACLTSFHTIAGFDCGSLAMSTFVVKNEVYFFFFTKHCFLKGKC